MIPLKFELQFCKKFANSNSILNTIDSENGAYSQTDQFVGRLSLMDFHNIISKGIAIFKLKNYVGCLSFSVFFHLGHAKENSEDPDHIMSSLICFCTVCQCHIK